MKKRLLALLLALCMLAALLPVTALAATPFRDVKPSDWFNQHVEFVYGRDLMSGTGATTFGPNDTTTRGMMVTVLWKLEGSPAATGATKFSDVKTTANSNKPDYFAQAVKWASENDVVAGYEDGRGGYTFKPNNKVTREQMAVMLYNYAKYRGYDTSATADLNAFPDGYRTSDWAVAPLRWANGAGIINGKADGAVTRLVPTGNATRAEMAAVFTTFTQKVVEGGTTASHTVTFVVEAGSGAYVHATQTVAHGSKVTLPDNPTSGEYPDWAGHEFDHWEGANGMTVDGPITADAEFVAVWSKVAATSHKVTFNLGYDGAPAPSNVTVAVGQPVAEPTAPTREGFTFLGWYTAASGGEKYVFDKAVTADMTLYAQWKETVTYKVGFNLNYAGADTVFYEENVVEGNTCPPIADPRRNDFIFDGWFTEKTDGDKFDFTSPITENITLYAHWTYDGINYAEPYNATGTIDVYKFNPDGENRSFSMMGRKYIQGFTTSAYAASTEANAAYSLLGNYDLITFEVGHVDNGRRDNCTLVVIADGEEVGSVPLTANMPTYTCAVNVRGVTQLQLIRRGGGGYGYGVGHVIQYTAADVLEKGLTVPETFTSEIVRNTNLEEGYILPYQADGPGVTVYNDLVERQNSFQMMGVKFYQGVTTGAYAASNASEYLFNLGGSFDTVTFTVGAVDNDRGDQDSTIYVYMDGVAMEDLAIPLTDTMMNTEITLNVRGVNQLRLYRSGGGMYYYGVGNITCKKSAAQDNPDPSGTV